MPARSKRPKPARHKASTAAGRSRAANRGKRQAAARRKGARKPAAPGKAPARKPSAPRKTAARKRPAKRKAAPRRVSLGPGRRRLVLVAVAAAALAAAYFGWFRDSALVAVRDVEVVGVSGSEKQRIEKALGKAAEKMTTLHVREDALAAAATAFPDVESVSADPSFPSGLEITVEQLPPVLLARSGGETVAAAEDGAVLPGVEVPKGQELPAIDVAALPQSGLLEGEDLEQALIVGATPEPLRPLVDTVDYESQEGVIVVLEGGLPVHFGTGARAEAKWTAMAAVLADPKLDRLTYVDVRVPERAAAGGAATPPSPEEEVAPVDPAAAVDEAPAVTGP